MHDNLDRVESAVSATASGDLTWDRWTHDIAVALGWAGKRNPLGFAVVRYLTESPNSINVWNVVLMLAKELEVNGIDASQSKDVAWKALDVWNNRRCQKCSGRGVINVEQETCSACGGTGERKLDSLPDPVKAGVSALVAAENWMEGQLRKMMSGSVYQESSDGHRVNLPLKDSVADFGFNRPARTPIRRASD